MSEIDLALQAIEFMETHLTDEIAVVDVADAVSLSLYHFSRTFSRLTRHPPYDYLMRRRLCEAARCLLASDEKIIDIALTYQFNAPETFSRAFKRMFDQQPRSVREQRWIDHRRLMPRFAPDYLEFLNDDLLGSPTVVGMPHLRVAGIAGQLEGHRQADGALCLWSMLDEELQTVRPRSDRTERYGVMIFLLSRQTDQCMYLAGISLAEGELAPTTFLQKSIAAMDYVCFPLSEQPDAARFTRDYVHHTWWPKAKMPPMADFEIEWRRPTSQRSQSRLLAIPIVSSSI